MIEEVYEKTKTAIKEFKNNPVHNLAILFPVLMSLFMIICGTVLYIMFIVKGGYPAQIQSFRDNGWWEDAKSGFSAGRLEELYNGIFGKIAGYMVLANIVIIMINYFKVNGKVKRILMIIDYVAIALVTVIFLMFLFQMGIYYDRNYITDERFFVVFGIAVKYTIARNIFLATALGSVGGFILLPLITKACRWMVGYMGLGVLTSFALIPLFFWVLQNILPLLGSVAFIALIIVGIWIMFKIMSALCTDHPEDIEFKQLELRRTRDRADHYRASADGYFKSANEGLNILTSAEDKRKIGRDELKKASAEDKYAKKLQEDIDRLKNKFDK